MKFTCIKFLSVAIGLLASASAISPAFAANKVSINAHNIGFSSINSSQEKFGELYWRGGLVLKTAHRNFGGFSGIELSKDGTKMLAVSDRGNWLKADIVYKDGIISDIVNASMAPILNAKGKVFKYWKADSEGLTKRNGSLNDVVISVERDQAIYRFKFGKSGLKAKAMNWGSIKDADKIPANRGLEAITALPIGHAYRGWMLTAAEKKLTKEGNHTAWLVNGKQDHSLFIKRHGGYDLTDLNYLPNGDIVLLERAIGLFTGPQMQIRQICGKDIKPNALVDGKKLLSANWGEAVDNMEGLAVHKAPNGEVILTVISDNNFHFLQRNLIMQFALVNNASVCQ